MGWCCHTAKSLDWQPGQVGKMKLDKVSLSGKKWGPFCLLKCTSCGVVFGGTAPLAASGHPIILGFSSDALGGSEQGHQSQHPHALHTAGRGSQAAFGRGPCSAGPPPSAPVSSSARPAA